MCELLEVSSSGFYAWQDRVPSKRKKRDAVLIAKMHEVHEESYGTYGVRAFCSSSRDGVSRLDVRAWRGSCAKRSSSA